MCGNGCNCSIADLSVEARVAPGETVVVVCQTCEGSGLDKFRREEDCWRCKGRGEVGCTTPQRNCPDCRASWIGGQIRRDSMELFGATHFGLEIGIDRFDGVVAWHCPFCLVYVSRFGPERILSKTEVFHGTRQELMG